MTSPSKRDPRQLPAEFESLCVADVMQRDLITVHASDPIDVVERVLADARISGVPVLDDNEKVIGILSMADLVDRYAELDERSEAPEPEQRERAGGEQDEDEESTEVVAFRHDEREELCAGDLMTTKVTFVKPATGLREAARIMVQDRIHRLLVVDKGRAVGILTTLDVLRAIAG